MAYNEILNISNTRRIALHELPSPIFLDVEAPTDTEVSTWVNGVYEKDTWDNVILLYNPPSYTHPPGDVNTYQYLWLVNYDRSLGIPLVTKLKSYGESGGGVDTNRWYVFTTGVDNLIGLNDDLAIFINSLDSKHGNIYQKLFGAWSLIGNIEGPIGPQGATGNPGQASNLQMGTVTTVAHNVPASASITGTPPSQILNLSIPKGEDGTNGIDGVSPADPNLSPGTITTLNPGDSATANIGGTYPNWTLNLGIPKGNNGTPGEDGFTFTTNTSNNVNTNTWSVNVYGAMMAASASPFTVYLPDVNTGLPNNGIGNWVIIVNSTTVTISVDLQHGDSVSPIKLSLAVGESCTYFAAGINPGNSNGYRWVSLNKF